MQQYKGIYMVFNIIYIIYYFNIIQVPIKQGGANFLAMLQ